MTDAIDGRYGFVEKVGRKWIHVRMSRSNLLLPFMPHDLTDASDLYQ
jgi:hypothetical protein